MGKRKGFILAALSVAVGAALCLPVVGFAEPDPEVEGQQFTSAVGGEATGGAALATALSGDNVSPKQAEWNDGTNTVTLLGNIKGLKQPLVYKSVASSTNSQVILDLAGFTLDVSQNNSGMTITGGGNLVITDSKTGGKITTAQGATIQVGSGTSGATNAGQLTVNKGTIEQTDATAEKEAGTTSVAIKAIGPSSVTITGEGSVQATAEGCGAAISASDTSTVTLSGTANIDGNTLGVEAGDGTSLLISENADVQGAGAVAVGKTGTPAALFDMTGGTLSSDGTGSTVTALILGDHTPNVSQISGGTITTDNGIAVQVGSADVPATFNVNDKAQITATTKAEKAQEDTTLGALVVLNAKSVVESTGGTITNSQTSTLGGVAIQTGGSSTPGGTVDLQRNTQVSSVSGNLPAVMAGNGGIVKIGTNVAIESQSTGYGTVYAGAFTMDGQANGGTITMEAGSVTHTGTEGAGVGLGGNSTFTMTDGTITSTNAFGVASNGATPASNKANINLLGGTINANIGVYAPSVEGVLTIGAITDEGVQSGPTIKATDCGVEVRAGTFTLNGGNISITNSGPAKFMANASGSTVTGAAIALSTHTTNQPIAFTGNGGTVTAPTTASALYSTSQQVSEQAADIVPAIIAGNYTGAITTPGESNYISGGTFVEPGEAFYNSGDTGTDYVSDTVAAFELTGKNKPDTWGIGLGDRRGQGAADRLALAAESGQTLTVWSMGDGDKTSVFTNRGVILNNKTDGTVLANGVTEVGGGKQETVNTNPPDLTKLEALIAEAEALDGSQYTTESWTVLTNALDKAKAALEDEGLTEAELAKIYDELDSAMSSLERQEPENPPTKTTLGLAIQRAQATDPEKYTEVSYKALLDALDAAQLVYDDPEATQADIDGALSALRAAMDALDPVTSPEIVAALEKLDALLGQAGSYEENKYTPSSWAAFQVALEEAKNVANSLNPTLSQVNDAISALQTAMDNLTENTSTTPPSKADLLALIKEAQAIEKGDYTDASWSSFQSALTQAVSVAENANATQTEIDAAQAALSSAMKSLTRNPGDGGGGVAGDNTTGGSGGSNQGGTTGVNKSALQQLVDQAAGLDQNAYTPDSWAKMQAVLEGAKTLLAKEDATQEEVNSMTYALQDALNALVSVKDNTSVDPSGSGGSSNSYASDSGYSSKTPKVSKMAQTGVVAFGSIFTAAGSVLAGVFTKRRINR